MIDNKQPINTILNERTNERTNERYTLIHGDCLSEMKKLHGVADVVFTSPPYNDSGKTESDKENKRHFKYEYAENREDWFEWQCECIDEMLKVAKRQVLYNVQPILNNKKDVYRIIGKYADVIDQILIWYKPNAQPQHYPHRIANCYEMVLVMRGNAFDKLYINSNGYKNVIIKNINSNHVYSDKHRALMSSNFCDEIISEFTLPTDTVLDCFMGLATTGISCLKFNRKFIGIEIHEPYFDIARKRMEQEASQMSIFDFLS